MPRWTKADLDQHPKRDSLLGVDKKAQPTASQSVNIPAARPAEPKSLEPPAFHFIVPGPLTGKPRQTQRDKWLKRPCVVRYRDFCDRTRAAAPKDLWGHDCFAVYLVAHIAVKPTWSKKKKAQLIGWPHRAKPDADNILKGILDALFKEDSRLWDVRCRKYWCAEGDERTVVKVLFNP